MKWVVFLIFKFQFTFGKGLLYYDKKYEVEEAAKHHLFPNAKVRYNLDTEIRSAEIRKRIQSAIAHIENNTCVSFVEVPQPLLVHDCVTLMIKFADIPSGDKKLLFTPASCEWPYKNAIVHLAYQESFSEAVARLLNAVAGLRYEHQRSDRDKYIKINWHNILPGYEQEFSVATDYPPDLKEFRPFLYKSFMNVGWYYKSKNGLPTIEPLQWINDMPVDAESDMARVNAQYRKLIYRWYFRGIMYTYMGPVHCSNQTKQSTFLHPSLISRASFDETFGKYNYTK